MTAPWHIAVLIPARNEEDLLPGCLRSVLNATSALPDSVTFDIVVAVDSSTDLTHEIAERILKGKGCAVCTDAGLVGRARWLAAEIALERYTGPWSRCWLANTDADCIVPPSWLNDQLLLASEQIEAVAGIIDVDDFTEHASHVEERFRSTYLLGSQGNHPHVHGANLGVRGDAYKRAGGWHHLSTAEDHDLWHRLAVTGARRTSVSHLQVLTSGRRVGRAPHGFADALAAHNGTAA